MSTLMAPSRVAARTTLTSQVLSEWPDRAANSSALALTDSGSRRVMRAMLPSSSSSAAGRRRGGGRRRAAAGGGASTTKASSRPSRRTSTPPVGISAVISAAAWLMASISASRAAGSRAKVSRSAAAWASGPAASAAASRSRRRLSTYGVMSMCTTMTSL